MKNFFLLFITFTCLLNAHSGNLKNKETVKIQLKKIFDKDQKLHKKPLKEPTLVNARRAQMGMETLEEYLDSYKKANATFSNK